MTSNTALLRLENVDAFYGNAHILHGLSLHVARGEKVALIGRNGVGKTTVVNTILGLATMRRGALQLGGQAVKKPRTYLAAQRGTVVVPQGRRIVANLSVEENLQLGAATGRPGHWTVPRIYELFPILQERAHTPGTALSGGQQQMLAMARALMSDPQVLLLDEPSMGLAPLLVREIFAIVRRLRDRGIPILLVEQNARAALSIADRGYVMETGAITLAGPAHTLLNDERVRSAYLGL